MAAIFRLRAPLGMNLLMFSAGSAGGSSPAGSSAAPSGAGASSLMKVRLRGSIALL
eukprot:CAMPEP_0179350230 /NCGR_PEP_ID=MMETSP0797-20121207/74648_1 /TAXON_ID=47934 /ORGANISM="Dinophysis acuminata, Strain DAEP01" /LENGTH=55 /DNA_ID=CAMNT_0021065135 /DNA_START=5 /DNA_END=169 /DNA_ORIENTATION=+